MPRLINAVPLYMGLSLTLNGNEHQDIANSKTRVAKELNRQHLHACSLWLVIHRSLEFNCRFE